MALGDVAQAPSPEEVQPETARRRIRLHDLLAYGSLGIGGVLAIVVVALAVTMK